MAQVRRHLINRGLAPLLLLCFLSYGNSQAIFKTINEDGTVSFSDQPAASAQSVDIPEVNTARSIEIPKNGDTTVDAKSEQEQKNEAAPNYEVSILSPTDGQEIGSSQHDVRVSLDIYLALYPGDTVEIYWNGYPYSEPSTSTEILLENVSLRIAPQLRAVIKDADGMTLATSRPITIILSRVIW